MRYTVYPPKCLIRIDTHGGCSCIDVPAMRVDLIAEEILRF
jgi:hypothetical protein